MIGAAVDAGRVLARVPLATARMARQLWREYRQTCPLCGSYARDLGTHLCADHTDVEIRQHHERHWL